MYDMFIQTQQINSVNNNTGSSNNITAHNKKRKLDYNVSHPTIQHALVQSSGDYQVDSNISQRSSVSGTSAAFVTLHNNALQKSPNQQTLMRASTIKLLDTYQRCGQKVFFYF